MRLLGVHRSASSGGPAFTTLVGVNWERRLDLFPGGRLAAGVRCVACIRSLLAALAWAGRNGSTYRLASYFDGDGGLCLPASSISPERALGDACLFVWRIARHGTRKSGSVRACGRYARLSMLVTYRLFTSVPFSMCGDVTC